LPGELFCVEESGVTWEPLLSTLVEHWTREIRGCPVRAEDPSFAAYQRRLKDCITYHAARFAEGKKPLPIDRVVRRLERGEDATGPSRGNLLRDVVLAQAMALNEPRAAEIFETEYMPIVRAVSIEEKTRGSDHSELVKNSSSEH